MSVVGRRWGYLDGALIGWGPRGWSASSGSFQSQAAVAVALADIVLRNEELQSARKYTSLNLARDAIVLPVRNVL